MVNLPSPVEELKDELFTKFQLDVWVKRDDLIHEEIMGNKWRKLKYNIQKAVEDQYKGLLTFGGAYSNHIAATAAAAREHQLQSIGVIRGDELNRSSNPTLRFANEQGMELKFVSRSEFRSLKDSLSEIAIHYPNYYVLPEGGTNHLAIEGASEIISELTEIYDYYILPIGTGGTFAGILKGLKGDGTVIGVSSLKGNWLDGEIKNLLKTYSIAYTNYHLIKDCHFGGYGKVNDELIGFINRIKRKNGLQLDPIYTGKMYFATLKLASEGFFPEKSKILVVHTGGLQGIAGYNEVAKTKILE